MKEVVIIALIGLSCLINAEDEGHFQVHDKKVGNLVVHATKGSAKISATADSIQMVIEPGMEDMPNKRNLIKKKIHHKKMEKQTKKEKKNKNIQRLILRAKNDKRPLFKKPSNRKSETHVSKQHDVTGTKKTLYDKEMLVHGQSGALHVHTDPHYTKLTSESGKLEIYLKNPEHYIDQQTTAEYHAPSVSVNINTEAYRKDQTGKPSGKIHLADITGLKKSVVNKDTQTNTIANEGTTSCLVPPCTSKVVDTHTEQNKAASKKSVEKDEKKCLVPPCTSKIIDNTQAKIDKAASKKSVETNEKKCLVPPCTSIIVDNTQTKKDKQVQRN